MVGLLKYQAGNISKDPEKANYAKAALESYNSIMGRNESATVERQKFLEEFEKTDGGKDKTKLKWLVTYNKKAVSNDVIETGCLENFFTRLSVWFLFPAGETSSRGGQGCLLCRRPFDHMNASENPERPKILQMNELSVSDFDSTEQALATADELIDYSAATGPLYTTDPAGEAVRALQRRPRASLPCEPATLPKPRPSR